MKRKLLITALFAALGITTLMAQLPNYAWAQSFGNANNAYGSNLCTDANGNIFLLGNFKGPALTFGTVTLTKAGLAGPDIFLVKFDPSGNALWGRNAGVTSNNVGVTRICADINGNVIFTGTFTSASFTLGGTTLTNATTGSNDVYVVKYDSAGNFMWAISEGGSINEDAGISTDALGNVFIGMYSSSPSITIGGNVIYNDSIIGLPQTLVIKYDASGNFIWVNNSIHHDLSAISTDPNGNTYITGSFIFTAIFDAITLTNSDTTGIGTYDLFITKYDSSGNVVWAKSGTGGADDFSFGLDADANGHVAITGSFDSNSLTFDTSTLVNSNPGPGLSDIFIFKLDSSGNVIWADGIEGTSVGEGSFIKFDSGSNLIVSGEYTGSSIILGSTTFTNPTPAQYDMFLVKYDASGNIVWADATGGVKTDVIRGLGVSPNGDVCFAGYFNSPTFQIGANILTNSGTTTYDIFLAKTGLSTGQTENTPAANITFYPNPFNNATSILIDPSVKIDKGTLSIYNSVGQEVKKWNTISSHEIKVNRDNLPAGIYCIRIALDEKTIVSKKLIITD